MSLPDLDGMLDSLREAVAGKDLAVISSALETINAALAELNPAVRATTYAQVQLELGKPLLAADVISDLIDVLGEDPKLCYQLGCYQKLGGALEKAESAFLRAVALDPDMTEGWIRLGGVLDDRGKSEAAIDCYRPVLVKTPEDPDAWRNLGNSLAALGRFSEASDAYDTALGLRPGDRMIAFLRASSYQARGELQRANDLLPESLAAELGPVIEVQHGDSDVDLRCRFHAVDGHEVGAMKSAASLLREVAAQLAVGADYADDVVVVSNEGVFLVCDRDPVRPNHPNRFFDVTVAVSRRMLRD